MEKVLLILEIIAYSLSIPSVLGVVLYLKNAKNRRWQKDFDEAERERFEARIDRLQRENLILSAKIVGRDLAGELAKDTIDFQDSITGKK